MQLFDSDRLFRRQPLIAQRALTSVRFGNLYFPGNQISRQAGNAAKMLFLMNPGERCEVSLRGTATLLRFKNRYWAITTRHQVDGSDVEAAGILANLPNHLTSSERCVWLGNSEDLRASDQYDLFAFEFTAPVESGVIPASKFSPLLDYGYLFDGDEVSFASTYGFRIKDQVLNWEDCDELGPRLSHLHMVNREILCEYYGDSSEPALALIRPLDAKIIEMDGMSGAPVFITTFSEMKHECRFGGIVVRGGNGHIYFIKHTVVRRLLAHAMGYS